MVVVVVGPKALEGRSWAEPKEAVVLLVRVWPKALEGRSRALPEEALVVGPGTQYGAQLPWVVVVVRVGPKALVVLAGGQPWVGAVVEQ